MLGPFENEEEILEAMLYWQKRALEAERDLEESLDFNEEYVDLILQARKERDYYKQQFLDKDDEMRFILGDDRGERE